MGTKTTSIPSPGSYGNQSAGGTNTTVTDNASYSFPENGWVDNVYFYTGGNGATITFTFGVYRTDTGALVAQTGSAGYFGKAWKSLSFSLNSSNNNSSGYSSPYLYLWSGYGWSAGSYSQGSQDFGINLNVGGFYSAATSGIASNRVNGGLNPYGNHGDLYYYLSYFPSATISAITAGPTPPGQNVVLTGTSFTAGINSVIFNGNGSGAVNASAWTVNSDTQLTVTVPTGATTGTVTVNTNAGAATSGSTTISSGRVYRSGVWSSAQAVMVYRSGAWTNAQGVYVYRSGAWTAAQ